MTTSHQLLRAATGNEAHTRLPWEWSFDRQLKHNTTFCASTVRTNKNKYTMIILLLIIEFDVVWISFLFDTALQLTNKHKIIQAQNGKRDIVDAISDENSDRLDLYTL